MERSGMATEPQALGFTNVKQWSKAECQSARGTMIQKYE
jgi:hypothetical protein